MRVVCALLSLVAVASPALAQRGPVIVVPGRPGIPVYINGIDASWGVVEGEFGLDRPGLVTPTVTYRPIVLSAPVNAKAYHPSTGKRPGYGRLEIVPPPDRAIPPPVPTYFRDWSAGSAPIGVSADPPNAPISIEVMPRFGRRGKTSDHNHRNDKGADETERPQHMP